MKKFSVNICVYHKDNPRDFAMAVESVTSKQTHRPDEVVIVADGPIYGELDQMVSRYESTPGFKVVRLPQNVGHAQARQAALEVSSNNIIALMDADDISRPERFALQMAYMTEHPDVAVVGGQIAEFIGDPANVVGERIVPDNSYEVVAYLKSRCPMNLVTVIFRKDKIQQAGGFIDWYCEEDYYLWVRMAERDMTFANLPQTLVNVRVGSEMYSRRGGWKYFKSEARLQGYMLRHGIISLPRYLYNTAGRFAVQVAMPNRLRGFIFQKLFRK